MQNIVTTCVFRLLRRLCMVTIPRAEYFECTSASAMDGSDEILTNESDLCLRLEKIIANWLGSPKHWALSIK